jgi:hypothetical protein
MLKEIVLAVFCLAGNLYLAKSMYSAMLAEAKSEEARRRWSLGLDLRGIEDTTPPLPLPLALILALGGASLSYFALGLLWHALYSIGAAISLSIFQGTLPSWGAAVLAPPALWRSAATAATTHTTAALGPTSAWYLSFWFIAPLALVVCWLTGLVKLGRFHPGRWVHNGNPRNMYNTCCGKHSHHGYNSAPGCKVGLELCGSAVASWDAE